MAKVITTQPPHLNPISVAYHEGPEAIGFGGRHWQRDIAQTVSADEWAFMQARADFNEFKFNEEQ